MDGVCQDAVVAGSPERVPFSVEAKDMANHRLKKESYRTTFTSIDSLLKFSGPPNLKLENLICDEIHFLEK
jgi:hypothetical protein